MQGKHEWHKFVKLTGNKEADFQLVSKLLTEHKILDEMYYIKTEKYGNVITKVHQKKIGGHTVKVFFDLDEPSGALLLKNGYVLRE